MSPNLARHALPYGPDDVILRFGLKRLRRLTVESTKYDARERILSEAFIHASKIHYYYYYY